jgi:hypothetical protein
MLSADRDMTSLSFDFTRLYRKFGPTKTISRPVGMGLQHVRLHGFNDLICKAHFANHRPTKTICPNDAAAYSSATARR